MNSELVKQRAKAFDYLFDSVVIVDLNGIITDWNKGSEKLYGYSKEEIIGKSVSLLHVLEDIENVTREVLSAVEEFGKWTGEIRMLHKGGNIGWIESMCVPFCDATGKVIGSLGINRDISKRVADEQDLKAKQVKLKHELDVKNRFFSIIGHDLNGPYSQLLGYTHILSNKAETLSKEEVVEMANIVHRAALQVSSLQKDLLQWSRLQFSSGQVVSKSISLHELVQDTIHVLKLIAVNKNISLINEICGSKVFADPDMIQSVIRNLISNALKFSHSGGEVVLSSKIKGDMLQVTVIDYGVGISKDQIENLFMLDNLISEVGTAGETGTGIGMKLCKEMVESNGGSIWANSTIGEGTQIFFSLPIEPASI